ncbi:hypothetical protein L249_6882 [Ophiocordyceps polyrhachis-furcata BCC 54312]|uniref:Uncharacterized protein n=1 Tax=Ophiocordyceps polyrhachis-furcata BCC 54312 TaxID=1330021 RepID=A0A367LL62_9HYPO|nr:hypothetical protein L249_6882 [Ophiocordyceps polyrhachis-furcata BCC 54312]
MERPPTSNPRVNAGEALSIYESARGQPRKRILVEPLLWTRLHLEILSCTFSHCSPAPPAMMHLPSTEDARQDARLRRDFERFFFGYRNLRVAKEGVLRGHLCDEPSPLSWCCDLYLHLGGNRSIILPCTYYCLGDYIPVAAHIDRSRILTQRQKKLGLPMGLRYSLPAFNVSELKLKSVTPTDPLHDPYLVALLIALGQLQWRALGRQKPQQAAGVTPKLMFSTEDRKNIYILSANISSSLINMFHYPAIKPAAPDPLVVRISSVAYEPIETLRGRLLALLLLLLSTISIKDVDKLENLIVYT